MNLKDFIITNGKAAGLSDEQISGVLASASRKLSGIVPKERWEEQVMTWINNRAKANREQSAKDDNEEKENSEH